MTAEQTKKKDITAGDIAGAYVKIGSAMAAATAPAFFSTLFATQDVGTTAFFGFASCLIYVAGQGLLLEAEKALSETTIKGGIRTAWDAVKKQSRKQKG